MYIIQIYGRASYKQSQKFTPCARTRTVAHAIASTHTTASQHRYYLHSFHYCVSFGRDRLLSRFLPFPRVRIPLPHLFEHDTRSAKC